MKLLLIVFVEIRCLRLQELQEYVSEDTNLLLANAGFKPLFGSKADVLPASRYSLFYSLHSLDASPSKGFAHGSHLVSD